MPTRRCEEISHAVLENRIRVTEMMVELQYARHPEAAQRYAGHDRFKWKRDANSHLDYLAQALSLDQPLLFVDYVACVGVMLARRNLPVGSLIDNLECMCEALRNSIPAQFATTAVNYVEAGMAQLVQISDTPPTFISLDPPFSALAREYLAALLSGERQRASRLVLDTAENGATVQDIYLRLFQPCQREIGRLWQLNQISVAQEHHFSAGTQLIMSQLYPYLSNDKKKGLKLVATCIAGERHEIGVRMVADLFELNGWDIFYLGADTPLAEIQQTLREQKADVLAISVTITPHLSSAKELIRRVQSIPDFQGIKILVGGYPFNIAPEMWRSLGADGYARDAAEALEKANHLVAKI